MASNYGSRWTISNSPSEGLNIRTNTALCNLAYLWGMDMNSLIEEELPGNQDLRDKLMEMLSDQELAYKLPGNNPTVGELCERLQVQRGDVR